MGQTLIREVEDERIRRGLREQLARLARRTVSGERVLGWKIALNSPAVQRRLGLQGPLLGYLTADSEHPLGIPLELVDPETPHLVEVEVALTIDRDLAADASASECRAAIGAVAPAFEILRFGGLSSDLESILAGNAYHERVVFGRGRLERADLRFSDLELALRVNREGSVPLDEALIVGEPAETVAFVARLLARLGRALQRGDRILCGSLNRPVVVNPGDRIEAELPPVGSLSLELAARPRADRSPEEGSSSDELQGGQSLRE